MINGYSTGKNSKVSIITVVLNGVKTIEKAIESVLVQSYKNIEYIIVDGMSTDGTDAIVSKYIDRISRYICEKDSGIYDAMNKGIRHATGDIIGILNADDWYEKETVEEAVSCFVNNPEAMVVAGRSRQHDADGRTTISNIFPMDVVWKHMPFPHPASFVRKEIYDKYGVYDTSFRICADYDFVFRIYVNNVKVVMADSVWVNFSLGGASTSDHIRTAQESNRIRSKYGELYPDLIDKCELKHTCDRELNYSYLLESIYRRKDLLVDLLNSLFPEGVSIYGFGIWGRMIVDFCLNNEIKVHGIYDRRNDLWETRYRSIRITDPEEIKNGQVQILLIAILYDGPDIADRIMMNSGVRCVNLDDLSNKIKDLMNSGPEDV